MFEEEADDEVVHHQQRDGTDQPSGDRVVVADDRVLHRVRQREQHDEVERVELRQLAFAEDAQQHDEEDIDDDRPQDLLQQREVRNEHVVKHRSLLQ